MAGLSNDLTDGVVHLCLDMQRLFSNEGPWAAPWLERILPNVVRLTEHAPERTVFTRFIPPMDAGDMPGMWRPFYRKWANVTRRELDPALLDLVPALIRHVPPSLVFDKMTYSAFADGRLHAELAGRNVTTLIVSGSETDVCVLSTVMAAVDIGYRVIIARDAVCSSSDEGHDALLTVYQRRLGVQVEIAAIDEILAAWRPA